MDKYHFDPFFRTQINVIGMLIVFSTFLVAFVGLLINYLYHDISLTIVTGVRESILTGSSTAPASAQALEDIRTDNLSIIAFITALATITFGYLLTRVALTPTRNALASQKQFIGNIAHELRTPLSVIKTNTEVALMGDAMIQAETKEIFESTVEELDRMSDIINNLLSLSASVRPERIEFTTVDIGNILTDVERKLYNLARARKITMLLRAQEPCSVWGNHAALEQIFTNLVKNAINYSPPSGRILITTAPARAHVEITVQDSGVGIAPEDLAHIFEPFYRAEPSRNRAKGSSGLGLTIVSELVRLHHGRIAIRSAVGRGTVITVTLPLAPASTPTLRTERSHDEVAIDYSHRKT